MRASNRLVEAFGGGLCTEDEDVPVDLLDAHGAVLASGTARRTGLRFTFGPWLWAAEELSRPSALVLITTLRLHFRSGAYHAAVISPDHPLTGLTIGVTDA